MNPLSPEALNQLFLSARTQQGWLDRPVSDDVLHQIYDLLKWGPTSANSTPGRILFVKSAEAKEKLRPCLMEGNVKKTMSAPVTAIIAQDMEFYKKLPKLAPHAVSWFSDPEVIRVTAFRNSSLQGAYLIVAARSLGLDCAPMSGFDNTKVDAAFFEGTSWKSNFICSIGYGDLSKVYPRAARLDFAEACRIV